MPTCIEKCCPPRAALAASATTASDWRWPRRDRRGRSDRGERVRSRAARLRRHTTSTMSPPSSRASKRTPVRAQRRSAAPMLNCSPTVRPSWVGVAPASRRSPRERFDHGRAARPTPIAEKTDAPDHAAPPDGGACRSSELSASASPRPNAITHRSANRRPDPSRRCDRPRDRRAERG